MFYTREPCQFCRRVRRWFGIPSYSDLPKEMPMAEHDFDVVTDDHKTTITIRETVTITTDEQFDAQTEALIEALEKVVDEHHK